DSDVYRRVFVCRPPGPRGEEPCARRILSTLARRAFRRPITEPELRVLMTFYRSGRAEGPFDAGIQRAIERMLIDVNFLFRRERDPRGRAAGGVYPLSDLELASRLSFFLWSSIPDDELLNVAVSGGLSKPGGLEAQVQRMLADKKSDVLLSNFFGQWLYLR